MIVLRDEIEILTTPEEVFAFTGCACGSPRSDPAARSAIGSRRVRAERSTPWRKRLAALHRHMAEEGRYLEALLEGQATRA